MRQALSQWMQTRGTQSADHNFPSEYRFRKRSLNRPAENWLISCCGSPGTHFLMLFQVTVRCVWIGNTWWEYLQRNVQMIWSSKLDPRTEKTDCIIAFLTLAKLTVQDYKIFLKHTTSQKESISSVVTLPMQLHRNWMKFPGATFIWGSVHSTYMCCLVKLCFFILTGSRERPGLLLPCGRGNEETARNLENW